MSQSKQKRNAHFVVVLSRCIVFILIAVFSSVTPAWAQQTCYTRTLPSTPDRDFADAGGGMVLHKPTGLVWKRCAEGQTWNGHTCTGEPMLVSWNKAFERVAAVNAAEAESLPHPNWWSYFALIFGGFPLPKPTEGAIQRLGANDWRLPNINELLSIVESSCMAPAVNTSQFPGSRVYGVWSSSPAADSPETAWSLGMSAGLDQPVNRKKSALQVYLVRGGDNFLDFYSGASQSESATETTQPQTFDALGLRKMPSKNFENAPSEDAGLPESMEERPAELSEDDQAREKLAFVAEPRAAGEGMTVAVPSLETWGLALLSLLLCGFGMRASRRK